MVIPTRAATERITRADFVAFGEALIRTRDLDPVYDLLRWVGHDAPSVDLFWLTFCYHSWYDVGSACRAVTLHPSPVRAVDDRLEHARFGTERRGFRNRTVNRMFASAWELGASHELAYWEYALDGDWSRWKESCEAIHGWGPWATWKWADLAREVLGWPIMQPDLQLHTSTGPRKGLVCVTGEMAIDLQVKAANELREETGWSFDVLETVLCKWHAHRHRRYWIGHDIAELRAAIDWMEVGEWRDRLGRGYVALFPPRA